jgi:5-(carboxyamino)imidazole ribonucleotide mutase
MPQRDSTDSSILTPLVGVIMGSRSDWATMVQTAETLASLGIPYETRVVSAHRTPDAALEYASTASTRGLRIIIAAAGGAAHLAGVTAAKTLIPVIGVPMESHSLKGMDSLLSIVQMPAGIPVATVAIGRPGAVNAALLAASILALSDPQIEQALKAHRKRQTETILAHPDPSEEDVA